MYELGAIYIYIYIYIYTFFGLTKAIFTKQKMLI